MKLQPFFMDRAAVLLLGVCVGSAIGFSFVGGAGPANSAPAPDYAIVADKAAAVSEALQPAQRQLLQRLRSGGKVRIAVFGDSFGDGVAFGLQQQLPGKAGYEVLKFSQPATGFTRYRRLNLEDKAGEQIGSGSIEIAVISFGANDAQGIITDAGDYAPLLSPKWRTQIGERLDRYVALLRSHGAMVYWVGLPRMRDTALDRDVGAINQFYAERMAALGVPFIDTRGVASDGKGQYAEYLNDPKTGARTLVREGDGIHMSMTGYKWITRALSDRIGNYVDAGRSAIAAKP